LGGGGGIVIGLIGIRLMGSFSNLNLDESIQTVPWLELLPIPVYVGIGLYLCVRKRNQVLGLFLALTSIVIAALSFVLLLVIPFPPD
jgi:hypothetical protein